MKILLVNYTKISGVEYYRSIMPSIVLKRTHPEYDFTTINYIHPTKDLPFHKQEETEKLKKDSGASSLLETKEHHYEFINDDYLKSFDLILFTRELGFHEHIHGVAERLRRLGIPFGVDTDDYWYLPENHIVYDEYKRLNRTWAISESMRLADFVLTTTPYLAKEIQELNKNVFIIENGLDLESDVWKPEHSNSEYMRFGFMLGATHYHDLKKASVSINNLFRSNNKGYQIVLCGFNAITKESKGVKIHSSPHVGLENLLTLRHSLVDSNYAKYLKKCTKEGNELWASQNYFRLWSVPVEEWGHQYKHIDLSVVPLVDTKFNNCKSELKAIEAGFKGKGLIVSNVKPYDLICNDKNAYLVNSSAEFYDKIKRALNNPNEVADKIGQLHTDVRSKYSLQKLTDKRKEVYDNYGA